jgi:hypothetical protein
MEKEFVPYVEALELKELGFNEPCFTYYYNIIGKLRTNIPVNIGDSLTYESNEKSGITLAPTFSQAFSFFRDKKLSDSCVCRYQSRDDGGIYYYYVINHDFGIEETKHFKEGFFSYEEAELECLKKLIEIVKNKTK